MSATLISFPSEFTEPGARRILKHPSRESGVRPTLRGQLSIVQSALPNGMLLVETTDGERVLVHPSGSMRVGIVRLVAGDAVRIERSVVDSTKGRIVGLERVFPDRQRRAPSDRRSNPVARVENDQ